MMKRMLIAFTILFLIVTQSVPYSDAISKDYATKGQHNGRIWLSMSNTEKEAYVAGMHDGAFLLWITVDEQKICSSKDFDKTLDSTFISKTRPNEIVKQIDSFYTDSTNLNIPIMRAYEVVKHKYQGGSPSNLEERIVTLRKIFNK